MPGELTPLVMLPRYTTFAGLPSTGSGPYYFSTIAMDVTEYSSAILNVWRGKLIGTAVAPKFTFQESSDQVVWTTCGGTTADFDPGENAETQYTATLTKRWFRIILELGNANNVLTCWAVGFLEQRLS
ncbi:MAG: hypothetical protein HUU06_05905 [Planctomycetaceae bacterium]|nr:hypothetical protein [Planctomycetaceae bacterium]